MIPLLLFIVATIFVITGLLRVFSGQLLWGICLIVIGCLIGPGGYSIFG